MKRVLISGLQRRALACIQDGVYPVPLSFCQRADVETSRSCLLLAPRDCILGDYGPWTQCGECGAYLSTSRQRPVLQQPNGFGRMCPPKHLLVQVSANETTSILSS